MNENHSIYFWLGWIISYPIRLVGFICFGFVFCGCPEYWQAVIDLIDKFDKNSS